MWVRKKIKEDKFRWVGRFNIKPAVFITVAACFVGALYGYGELKYFVIFVTVVFLVAYIGQIIFRDPQAFMGLILGSAETISHNDICNSCHKIRIRTAEKKCECGGTFEPFENWEWVKDEK